jgi:hypothetical protein
MRIALVRALLCLLAFASSGCPKPVVRWSPAANLNEARMWHTATKLQGGRVLVTGGVGASQYLSSVEIYDPATNAWTAAPPMSKPRAHHTATLLLTGKVLVAGGLNLPGLPGSAYLDSAELFDPATNIWAAAPSMTNGRAFHTASRLGNGSVVVTGGLRGTVILGETEIFVPGPPPSWYAAAPMANARTRHASTTLADGIIVLVAGGLVGPGTPTDTAEQYDSVQNKWTTAGSLQSPRSALTLTLMPVPAKAIAAGGVDATNQTRDVSDLYAPGAFGTPGTWTAAQGIGSEHADHTATLLGNGSVLVAGGLPQVGGVDSSTFDEPSKGWTYQGGMSSRRLGHTATLLDDGRVLVVGGFDNTAGSSPPPIASTEIFKP